MHPAYVGIWKNMFKNMQIVFNSISQFKQEFLKK